MPMSSPSSINPQDLLEKIVVNSSIVDVVVTVVTGIVAAFASGFFKRIKIGPLEIESGIDLDQVKNTQENNRAITRSVEEPFEVVALSNYYNHALKRANISFWFSIVFGAIGFGVIILSFVTYNAQDIAGSILKTASGAIIDAISSIFFVISTNAQKSMAEFFEKLRLDRLNAEAKSLVAEVENPDRRDELRAQLVLKYAAIDKLLTG